MKKFQILTSYLGRIQTAFSKESPVIIYSGNHNLKAFAFSLFILLLTTNCLAQEDVTFENIRVFKDINYRKAVSIKSSNLLGASTNEFFSNYKNTIRDKGVLWENINLSRSESEPMTNGQISLLIYDLNKIVGGDISKVLLSKIITAANHIKADNLRALFSLNTEASDFQRLLNDIKLYNFDFYQLDFYDPNKSITQRIYSCISREDEKASLFILFSTKNNKILYAVRYVSDNEKKVSKTTVGDLMNTEQEREDKTLETVYFIKSRDSKSKVKKPLFRLEQY